MNSLTPFLLQWLITALSLWVTSHVFKGIKFESTPALVISALLLGFAWLGLCGVLVLWLVEQNLSPSLALLAAVLLNLAGVLGFVLAARRKQRLLSVPGTHKGIGGGMLLWLAWRQLRPAVAKDQPAGP